MDSTVLPVSFSDQTPSYSRFCPPESRLRFSSGIVERPKRERARKSPPHARKGDTRRGDFHARSRFAPSTILEEKWGTTRSLVFIRNNNKASKGREGCELQNFRTVEVTNFAIQLGMKHRTFTRPFIVRVLSQGKPMKNTVLQNRTCT